MSEEKGETPSATRREFLRAAASLAVLPPIIAGATLGEKLSCSSPVPRHLSLALNSVAAAGRAPLLWVGTYSSPQGPEGAKGRGEGIYLFVMDPVTGALTRREVIRNDANPSCLALHPSGRFLYSANEISTYQGTNSGSVSAYAVDSQSGHLSLLNTVSSEGAAPAYLSVHPAGKFVLVANYYGGSVAVLPVQPDGRLRAASHVIRDHGDVGSEHAASAPPGSFAISGHEQPHAHMIQADAAGRFVFASDLGLDRIFIWKFDSANGKLIPNSPDSVALPGGDGPRHFAFHPQHPWFYSLQEEGSTLVVYDYDSSRGRLTKKQTLSSLPEGFAGTNYTSEVAISADGKFLYAANRLHDSIAWFPISDAGTLTFGGEEWTRGDYPRSFTIDPSGNFLYCGNQRADAITTFRINRQTGRLTFTGQYTPVGTPSHIVFNR